MFFYEVAHSLRIGLFIIGSLFIIDSHTCFIANRRVTQWLECLSPKNLMQLWW